MLQLPSPACSKSNQRSGLHNMILLGAHQLQVCTVPTPMDARTAEVSEHEQTIRTCGGYSNGGIRLRREISILSIIQISSSRSKPPWYHLYVVHFGQ